MNYAVKRKANFVVVSISSMDVFSLEVDKIEECRTVVVFFALTEQSMGRNLLYTMSKKDKLRQSGTLNSRPKQVRDPLFEEEPFFDANDLAQIKYEMLRKVSHDGKTISEATRLFGFSRPSFYKAQTTLEQEGLPGLIPKKSGPRAGHKLTDEALEFIRAELKRDSSLSSVALADLLRANFGTEVHPRSIERALVRKKKRK